jgi:hypothetical protein
VHDHEQTLDPMLLLHHAPLGIASSRHLRNVDRSPITFDVECKVCQRIDQLSVRLRVPMVLFFIGSKGHESDELIRELDASHNAFGAKNIQLLIVISDTPSRISVRLNITVPIIGDNGLAALLHARPNGQSPNAAVIMGNDGRALNTVRKFPFMHPTLPIFGRIDCLTAQFPQLFCVTD